MQYDDTIYALSSGAVPAGVAVIRISGPKCRFGLETISGALPADRQLSLRSIRDRDETVIDRALVVFFPGPNSFTGEDCSELHVHGGRAVVSAVLDRLAELPGYRHAEAGEFTQRAFANGRLDLTEVEGLADLIAAQTEMQRRLAMASASGGQLETYRHYAERLLRARALIEAELDFSDEEDIPGSVSDQIWPDLAALAEELGQHIEKGRKAEIVRDGFRVAIAGPVNAGKSSLMNVLAGRDVAIVSQEAGTTRDVLSVDLDIGGYAVTISDTAGIRDDVGEVEKEGIRRARVTMEQADMVLLLSDGSERADVDLDASLDDGRVVRVRTKCDLAEVPFADESHDLVISTVSGEGIDALVELIGNRAKDAAGTVSEALPARERQRACLRTCKAAVERAVVSVSAPIEVRAEYLREAGDALGRLTGKTGVEDMLGVIFAEFCVGK